MPGLSLKLDGTVHAFGAGVRLFKIKGSIDHCIVQIFHSVSDIWVKLYLTVLFLGLKWRSLDLGPLTYLFSFIN